MNEEQRLPRGIVDRVEEFLIRHEERLVSEGMTLEEAQDAVEEMEERVLTEIRSHPVYRTSMAHLEEYLESLTPSEEQTVTPLFESFPSGPKLPNTPRIPRLTLFALGWMGLFFVMLGLIFLPEGILNEKDPGGLQKFLVNVIVTFGMTAPVGTTALGLVGLRRIHFGNGMFVGERLTTGVTLFFPTILFAMGMVFLGRKVLEGHIESPWLDGICLALSLTMSYYWVQFQLRLIRDWFERMTTSGVYWKQVGDIPPSGRPNRHSSDKNR
ncbi:MAG: hypothetical protein KC994_07630 [Candidatus Omnitrophica bacterium]|nr:hypothetical protein [Candidatus Omnitrophota bacterium]